MVKQAKKDQDLFWLRKELRSNVRNCVKNEIMKISEKQPQMSVISGLFFVW